MRGGVTLSLEREILTLDGKERMLKKECESYVRRETEKCVCMSGLLVFLRLFTCLSHCWYAVFFSQCLFFLPSLLGYI